MQRVRYVTLIVTYETWMSHITQLGVTYVVCSEPPDQAGLNGRHDRVLDDGGVLSVGFSRLMPSRISTGRVREERGSRGNCLDVQDGRSAADRPICRQRWGLRCWGRSVHCTKSTIDCQKATFTPCPSRGTNAFDPATLRSEHVVLRTTNIIKKTNKQTKTLYTPCVLYTYTRHVDFTND